MAFLGNREGWLVLGEGEQSEGGSAETYVGDEGQTIWSLGVRLHEEMNLRTTVWEQPPSVLVPHSDGPSPLEVAANELVRKGKVNSIAVR